MIKVVPKKWGTEWWIVNDEYCGKLLHIKQGKRCSLHYHPVKKETFYVLEGKVNFNIDGVYFAQTPITIEPGTPHQFYGITDATILEISTHHDDKDVVRITESE